ncbi:hypothetical protein NP493_109g03009 [Ridgeia piscesae]|uniref:Uncharacterized protein n=1 Tax=Ridgeia piscesae TaxID=27915 RepID=A0AAD9UH42_RIDPI|nr:hypothetical protein NP493_109g03009 [Ridgeia piscesae]
MYWIYFMYIKQSLLCIAHSVCNVCRMSLVLTTPSTLKCHALDIHLVPQTFIVLCSPNLFVMYVRCQWFIILCMSHYWFTHIKGCSGGCRGGEGRN